MPPVSSCASNPCATPGSRHHRVEGLDLVSFLSLSSVGHQEHNYEKGVARPLQNPAWGKGWAPLTLALPASPFPHLYSEMLSLSSPVGETCSPTLLRARDPAPPGFSSVYRLLLGQQTAPAEGTRQNHKRLCNTGLSREWPHLCTRKLFSSATHKGNLLAFCAPATSLEFPNNP